MKTEQAQEAKHTPGPWINTRDGFVHADNYEHDMICQLHSCYVKEDNSLGFVDLINAKANAELIARAPSLLSENTALLRERDELKLKNAALQGEINAQNEREMQDFCAKWDNQDWESPFNYVRVKTEETMEEIKTVQKLN